VGSGGVPENGTFTGTSGVIFTEGNLDYGVHHLSLSVSLFLCEGFSVEAVNITTGDGNARQVHADSFGLPLSSCVSHRTKSNTLTIQDKGSNFTFSGTYSRSKLTNTSADTVTSLLVGYTERAHKH
jgi:hypothetical protein